MKTLLLLLACLTTQAANFGATDLHTVPLGYPVGGEAKL